MLGSSYNSYSRWRTTDDSYMLHNFNDLTTPSSNQPFRRGHLDSSEDENDCFWQSPNSKNDCWWQSPNSEHSRKAVNPPAKRRSKSSRDLSTRNKSSAFKFDSSDNNCCFKCPPTCCKPVCCRLPAPFRMPAAHCSFPPLCLKTIPCPCKKTSCSLSCPRPLPRNCEPCIPVPPCCPPKCPTSCCSDTCCAKPADLGSCFVYVDSHDLLAENVKLRSAIKSIKMKTLEECSCVLDALVKNYKSCSQSPCCPEVCCPCPPKKPWCRETTLRVPSTSCCRGGYTPSGWSKLLNKKAIPCCTEPCCPTPCCDAACPATCPSTCSGPCIVPCPPYKCEFKKRGGSRKRCKKA